MLKIKDEFKYLIPPLLPEELDQLEKSILEEGIREPLIVWVDYDSEVYCKYCHKVVPIGDIVDGEYYQCSECGANVDALDEIIVDGHNRYEIAQKHNLEFETREKEFENEKKVQEWIILNQFGRRNLTAYDRSVLALKLKDLFSAESKAEQISKLKQYEAVHKKSCEREIAKNKAAEIKEVFDNKDLSWDAKIYHSQTIKDKYGKLLNKNSRKEEAVVYIALTEHKIKVGFSSSVDSRIDDLKSSDPDIQLYQTFKGGQSIELKIHKKFKDFSIGGEWYKFTQELLDKIVSYAHKESQRENETSARLAKIANVSHDTISKVEKIEAKATDEQKNKIRSGEVTINRVYKDIKREERKKEYEEGTKENPLTGKYRIIYADPPWKYNDKLIEEYGGADKHYNTMSIEQLCILPIKEMAEDNAVLFLWVTSPFLERSFEIIRAWGFKYKTSFVWDKVKHNMGHYNSVRHEFLLVCTKGSCTPDNLILFDSVQSIERTDKHSEKPGEFRKIIDTIYTSGKRIELFARTKKEGWESWGNQV